MSYLNTVYCEIGVVNMLYVCIGKNIIAFFYFFSEPVRDAPYAQFRIKKSVCKGRNIFSVKFKKSVLDSLSQRKSPDALCYPFCAYPAAVDPPHLLTVFPEVDIEHCASEIADYPIFKRDIVRLFYQSL